MSNEDTNREDYKGSAETPGASETPLESPISVWVTVLILAVCSALVVVLWLKVMNSRESDPLPVDLTPLTQRLASLDNQYPMQPSQAVEHRSFMAQCDETDLLCMQVSTQDPAATFEMLSAAMPKNGERRYLLRIAVTPLDADDSPASPAPTRLQQTIAY